MLNTLKKILPHSLNLAMLFLIVYLDFIYENPYAGYTEGPFAETEYAMPVFIAYIYFTGCLLMGIFLKNKNLRLFFRYLSIPAYMFIAAIAYIIRS